MAPFIICELVTVLREGGGITVFDVIVALCVKGDQTGTRAQQNVVQEMKNFKEKPAKNGKADITNALFF